MTLEKAIYDKRPAGVGFGAGDGCLRLGWEVWLGYSRSQTIYGR